MTGRAWIACLALTVALLEERGGAERRGGSPPGGRTADQGGIVPALASAEERTATFDYTGWYCARCGPKIEQALRKTKAVKSALATLDRVTVVYDDRFTDPDKLAAMIEAAGPYKVAAKRVVTPTPTPAPAPSSRP